MLNPPSRDLDIRTLENELEQRIAGFTTTAQLWYPKHILRQALVYIAGQSKVRFKFIGRKIQL